VLYERRPGVVRRGNIRLRSDMPFHTDVKKRSDNITTTMDLSAEKGERKHDTHRHTHHLKEN
jgi:hypothetical protein